MTETATTSNASAADIARFLAGKRSVVAITHAKPDGDAIGSTIAIVRALNIEAGGSAEGFSGVASRAEAWYAGPVPPWAGGITLSTKTRVIDSACPPTATEPDAVVICDTASRGQLAPYFPWLDEQTAKAVVIDHHLRGDSDIARLALVEPQRAAACEIAADVCVEILRCGSVASLPVEVATPLYLGIATDTGWFKHANVKPATMRLAADLMETGVDHERLFETIEQRDRPARLRLLARALASLELHHEDTVATMRITRKDLEASGASPGESGGFVDYLRSIASVRVAAVLTEATDQGKPLTKLSLRSKGGPDMIDVNKVAGSLGGGGHAQAAGARLPMKIADAQAKLLEALA